MSNSSFRSAAGISGCLALALSAGCLQTFEPHSAYDDQVYLCDDPEAWAASVEACRLAFDVDRSCGGVLSFRGRLQATDIVGTSDASGSALVLRDVDGPSLLFDRIDLNATTPYFVLTLRVKNLGGAVEDAPQDVSLTYDFDAAGEERVDGLDDNRVEASLRITNGAESDDLIGLTDRGTVTLLSRGRREGSGTFEGAFGVDDDVVEGCFHILALEVRVAR